MVFGLKARGFQQRPEISRAGFFAARRVDRVHPNQLFGELNGVLCFHHQKILVCLSWTYHDGSEAMSSCPACQRDGGFLQAFFKAGATRTKKQPELLCQAPA